MIAAQSVVPKQRLKIKFPSQRIEAIPAPQSFEFGQQLNSSFDGKKESSSRNSQETSGAYKRGPERVIVGGPREKRQKMDRSMTQQCSALLKALMKHPAGWVFCQPVDPKALNIPDYFTIIKNPMDLGTIKSKLVKNTYLGIQEFVADIKLTFSNAMLYNPPSNNVHKMAEEMNEFFEARWKSLEENWNQENKVGLGKILSVRLKDVNESKQSHPKTQLCRNSSLPKKSKPSEEKVLKVPLNARAVEVEPSKLEQNCVSKFPGKNLQKGSNSVSGGRTHGSINAKPPLSPGACKCSSCGSIKCQCSLPSDSNHASSSDITSDRSYVGDLRTCSAAAASKLDCQARSTSTSQMSKSDPDSDGAVSALDDENVCPSSQLTIPATYAASSEGLLPPIFDMQLSPKKALRVAMLKSRFADTILKAQQKTLLDHGDKADPLKMQQEKERLERRQREEKAKIEAQVRTAEAAAKMKAEVELKKQREREREAARIALQKMEKTAEIELNLEIVKELEILSGCSLSSNHLHGRKSGSEKVTPYGGSRGNPLHKLGLFIKDEYLEEDDDEALLNEDGEEGEILS